MEQSTLKNWRLLIPGIIIYIIGQLFYSTLQKKEFSDFNMSDIGIPFIAAVVLGAIYQISGLRYLVTNFSHKQIDINIKKNIINLYNGHLSNTQRQFLFNKNRLKQIFYKIIDNDTSLSIKKGNVFFNGLLWTSFADIFIISFLSAIFFFTYSIFGSYEKLEIRNYSIYLLTVSFLSLIAHILTFFNQIKLSNDQIEFIETNHINTIKTTIEQSLRENNVN
ncbi:hypothetical protein [uncultured Chryseobacterium sp.]|uniref:hypothetical protein n=1 Tax=uncultured Chryseobacterium sp. TaxID=259322 RepID=UPI0025D7E986|nr:hypothetical protein [uncultured Chryseobacterium sp.]